MASVAPWLSHLMAQIALERVQSVKWLHFDTGTELRMTKVGEEEDWPPFGTSQMINDIEHFVI